MIPFWPALAVFLAACGGSAPQKTPEPAPPAGQAMSLGAITVHVPDAWSVKAQVARVPASPARCTVQRLPPNAARDYAAVKASADRITANPPDGVEASYIERPLGELPGVEVTLKNNKMQGDWRSIQRMLVAADGCIVVAQCSGPQWTEHEAAFKGVLDTVQIDPAKCAESSMVGAPPATPETPPTP